MTAFPEANDPNSLWTVRGAHGKQCKRGDRIPCNSEIKLLHVNTKKFLHSHLHQSPLSRNQEVSAYPMPGDEGDNWIVHCLSKNTKFWERESDVRLQHKATGAYLASNSEYKYQNPIPGQAEVYGTAKTGSDTTWQAKEGFYFGDNLFV